MVIGLLVEPKLAKYLFYVLILLSKPYTRGYVLVLIS